MAANGQFDPELRVESWFADEQSAEGWFDPDLVSPASVGGAASITGAGQIASAEAFGAPVLAAGVTATGIASAEAAGSPAVAVTVAVAGITTGETAGSPALAAIVAAAGIASAEAIGAPVVLAVIAAAGLASAETLGSPATAATVEAAGVASLEALGQPIVSVPGAGWDITGAGGIISAEEVGSLALSREEVVTVFTAPARGGGRGAPRRSTSRAERQNAVAPVHRISAAGGILSAEAFGHPRLVWARPVRQQRVRREEEILLLCA